MDEFHLSKYVLKNDITYVGQQRRCKSRVCKIIRDGTKKEFDEIVERLEGCAKTESAQKIQEGIKHIKNNWTAAKTTLEKACVHAVPEGHVSHVLSSRMSTLALGWSRLGASKMARLREWHYNKNSMLELVRSQKAELPMVAGAEELIMSASDIISSEINRRTKAETISGKYEEIMNTTLGLKTKKQLSIYVNRWI